MSIQATAGERAVRYCERLLFGVLGVDLAVLMLFVAGNFQGFALETQYGLLRWMRLLSSVVGGGGVVLAVAALIVAIYARRGRMVVHFVALLVVGGIGLLILLAATTVTVLQQPL